MDKEAEGWERFSSCLLVYIIRADNAKQKITFKASPYVRLLFLLTPDLKYNLISFSSHVGVNINWEQKYKWKKKKRKRKDPQQFLQRLYIFKLVWRSSGWDLSTSNLQQTAVSQPLIYFHPCVLYSHDTEHTRQTAALRHSP